MADVIDGLISVGSVDLTGDGEQSAGAALVRGEPGGACLVAQGGIRVGRLDAGDRGSAVMKSKPPRPMIGAAGLREGNHRRHVNNRGGLGLNLGVQLTATRQCRQPPTSRTGGNGCATITFRPDEDTSKALEGLTKDGTAVSAAVRSALIDAARRKAGAAIRAEAERLAEDDSDRAEARQVLRDMETLHAWSDLSVACPAGESRSRAFRFPLRRSRPVRSTAAVDLAGCTNIHGGSCRQLPTREVEIGGVNTRVLAEQTAAVDPGRLGKSVGFLTSDELRRVDAALRVLLILGFAVIDWMWRVIVRRPRRSYATEM